MNHWTHYPCRTHLYTLEVVAGKVWTNAIEVNKVINMKKHYVHYEGNFSGP